MVTGITEQMVLEGCVTTLAIELDRAMASDPVARARYAEIWGVEWSPIVDASIMEGKSHAMTTTLKTVR